MKPEDFNEPDGVESEGGESEILVSPAHSSGEFSSYPPPQYPQYPPPPGSPPATAADGLRRWGPALVTFILFIFFVYDRSSGTGSHDQKMIDQQEVMQTQIKELREITDQLRNQPMRGTIIVDLENHTKQSAKVRSQIVEVPASGIKPQSFADGVPDPNTRALKER